ncbi:aquaporin Z [Isoptericola sp. CG 20/1183]|uniref:Aquaporin Z n=1 Tax=Isoptericola halotolerans TaxID=300560 RepID=A0ABX5EEH1_9MICO|nr:MULTISPECIES: aquaporin [Isoptericola]MCK0118062.1 aquaporin [Isoptericola sp. S6320L]PRZ06940.1 aquaporin Z [Isoptericola halotolerans]PRZ07388.1 aquaporin Z [Isoptericola sp. CG 20/1183]
MSQATATQTDLEAAPVPRLFTRMCVEAFGTFVLVLGIVGTATFNALNGGQIIPVALAGGIALIAVIAGLGHISGGHFNPAVTFGLTLAGRSSWADLAPYWLAQLVGAAACGALLLLIIPGSFPALVGSTSKGEVLAATANGYGDHSPLFTLTQGQSTFDLATAAIVEVLIAVVFVGVILAVTNARAKVAYAPVVIGLTLAALHIVSWPVTNTSFNPARSLASVISPDAWGDGGVGPQLWLFFVAPLAGAALAALFARAFAPMPALTPADGWEEQPGTATYPPEGTLEEVAEVAAAKAVADDAAVTTVAETEVVEETEVVADETGQPVAAETTVAETSDPATAGTETTDSTTPVDASETGDEPKPPTRP